MIDEINEKKRELLGLIGETLGDTDRNRWYEIPDQNLDGAMEMLIKIMVAEFLLLKLSNTTP